MSKDLDSGISGLFGILIIGLLIWLVYWLGSDLSETLIKIYHNPDTTITIHNGIPDTVIIIRK